MMVLTIVMSVFLSIFSTAVMSYIAMATPLGPWIAPSLVLIGMAFLRLLRKHSDLSERLVLSVAAGSVGGILATACGFAFPTLYFLDPSLFAQWLQQPVLFICILGGLSFTAGWLGLWLANFFEYSLIVRDALPFPVGNMIYKIIVAQTKLRKTYDLFIGFWSTIIFCYLRSGIGMVSAFIPQVITFLPPISFGVIQIPAISFSLMPMFWAIGFVTGIAIVSSLLAGSVAKIILVEPIRKLYFPDVESMEFILAFCSGMVIAGVFCSFMRLPSTIMQSYRNICKVSEDFSFTAISQRQWLEFLVLLLSTSAFLHKFGFGILSQIYLIFFSAACAYQIALIAGKSGLAQLGRFATFVMVPAMFLFKLDYVQIVFIATFVEVCGGVMTDIIFGRKLAYLASISQKKVRNYQYFGLIISSLVVGVVFWLLLSHFQLGGAELFAQRAQARALLIRAQNFNLYVLFIGIVFGFLLKLTPLNPMLVLGGFLMPINLILGLAGGALLATFTKKPQKWIPFWSGVFAANSIWMIVRAFLRYLL